MIIDVLFVIIIITALVKGYSNGFIVAIFSLIGLMVGLAAATKLSAIVAVRLKDSVNVASNWLPVLSFILVFLVAILLVRLGAKAIQKMMELVMLGWLNRLAGIVLYILLYTIIFSVVLFYTEKIHLINTDSVSKSTFYPFIQPWGPRVLDSIGIVLPFFKNMFHELETFFEGIANRKS